MTHNSLMVRGDDVGLYTTSFIHSAHVVYENIIFETFHGAGYGERQTAGGTVKGIRSLVVDKSGGAGNYRTVQEAVDAVSVFNTQRVLIQIREGTFL